MLGGYPWSLAHDSHSSHSVETCIPSSHRHQPSHRTNIFIIVTQNYFHFYLTSFIEIRPHTVHEQSSGFDLSGPPPTSPGLEWRAMLKTTEILYIIHPGNSNFYLAPLYFLALALTSRLCVLFQAPSMCHHVTI